MQPDLKPGFSFQKNISGRADNFPGVEREFRIGQGDAAPAKKQAARFRRFQRIGHKSLDLLDNEPDWIFVVDAPINPLFVVEIGDQL